MTSANNLYVDSAKRFAELMHTYMGGHKAKSATSEFEARKKDGSTLWLLVNASSNTTDRYFRQPPRNGRNGAGYYRSQAQ